MAQTVPEGVAPAAESAVRVREYDRERDSARFRARGRWRRHHAVKAKVEGRRELRIIYGDPDGPPPEPRPRTRADCADAERPCPWVGCKHHLYLDVTDSGGIKFNFPHLEPDEIPVSCALDVAAEDGVTLEEIASKMNLTRERVRQIEVVALAKLKRGLRPEE